jgi:oligopeptide/dipeptide ABC transporter ATP-binding protein
MPLLDIQHLQLDFRTPAGPVRTVDDVSLSIEAGETLGLVGESGCGKSVTALSIGRLVPEPPARYAGGRILLAGQDVLALPAKELRALRGGTVSYVFQDPAASLNPVMRIGKQIREALRLHRPELATEAEVVRLLKLVRIPAPETRVRAYPFELSGGMQQRVMIAMALASQPKLLVADEPTTALDVTIQAQIMDLLRELKERLGMSILLITHNLGLVGGIANRVAVMYAGQIVESAPARELLRQPLHPYSQLLLGSVPRLKQRVERLKTIPGTVPHAGEYPAGCRFAARCPLARPECRAKPPELLEAEPGRLVRCPYGKEVRE